MAFKKKIKVPTRTMMIPLHVKLPPGSTEAERLALHRRVLASRRLICLAAQQVFATLFAAQAAGATIDNDGDDGPRCTPHNDRAKAVLNLVFNRGTKPDAAPIYAVRQYVLDYLLPTVKSPVWDELRAFVWQRWTAKDPEFPKVSRGWLTLQNVRGLAIFRKFGIGFSVQTGKPILEPHQITLHWDKEIGPVVFNIGDLDPARWATWRRITSGEWPHGTLSLNERDGELVAYVSYKPPAKIVDLDPERVMEVSLDGERLKFVGPDGKQTLDEIGMREVIDWLARTKMISDAWHDRQKCTGSPRKPWGERRRFKAISKHRNTATVTRITGQQHRHHAWAKRIATRAGDWRCGVVHFIQPKKSELAGHPWSWTAFAACVKYKLEYIGAKLVVETPEPEPTPEPTPAPTPAPTLPPTQAI